MRVVTPEEMRDIDARSIREYGIPEEILMERAGMAVAWVIQEYLDRLGRRPGGRILAIAGGGHNGADSLVALREMVSRGFCGEALIAEENPSRHSEALLREIERLRHLNVSVRFQGEPGIHHRLTHAALIVDGILGTGFHGSLPDKIGSLTESLNAAGASGTPVISVDIPSGVDGLSGRVDPKAVQATATVTFGLPKWGLLADPGTRLAGDIWLSRIGFPPRLLEGGTRICLTPQEAIGIFPKRTPVMHKGHAGHVVIAGGGPGKSGAVLLAAKGALRTGAGLVTVMWDREFFSYSSSHPEVMAQFFDANSLSRDHFREVLLGKDAVGCGPGLPDDPVGRKLMEIILSEYSGPVVADAGTFSIFAGRPEGISDFRRDLPTVLTPHPGELGRLLGLETRRVLENPLERAQEAAQRSGSVVLLKGARTIVVTPDGSHYINLTGHSVMAGAGMGDVLTGVVVTLLAQGLDPFRAACLGAFFHGTAGERLGQESSRGRLASELADALPKVLAEWENLPLSRTIERDPILLVSAQQKIGESE